MPTMFEKLSAKVRSGATLPELRERRIKTAARIKLCQEAGNMPDRLIAHLQSSLADYDRRIAAAEHSQIAKLASTMRLAIG